MIAPAIPFVLIRHGQTDANRDGRIAGRTEAVLTEAGRAGAARLAGWHWPGTVTLFSSPQGRAVETAALAFPGRAPRLLPGLRERDWGRHEGAPVATLPPRAATPEGGEAWQAMLDRVAEALATALAQALAAAGPVLPVLPVLVAHSGVIRAVRQLTGGRPDGPSPPNTTPILFAPASPASPAWRETTLTEKDLPWIA